MKSKVKILIISIFLLIFIGNASAWYNDEGNDSCFAIFSDKGIYACEVKNDRAYCEAEIQFENNCGVQINDAQLGLFLPNDLAGLINFQKVELWKNIANPITTYANTLQYTSDANIISTAYAITPFWTNLNGTDYKLIKENYYTGSKYRKCHIPELFPNRCYYYDSIPQTTEIYQYGWADITSILVQNADIQNIQIGKTGFTLKIGWTNITIPIGFNKKIKIYFNIPKDTKGEFIIAGRSGSNYTYKSILDPMFYSKIWTFDVSANYIYDSSKIEITGGQAQLKLQTSNPTNAYFENLSDNNAQGWIADVGTWAVSNQKYYQTSSTTNNAVSHYDLNYWKNYTTGADVNIYITAAGQKEASVIGRFTDTSNFYSCILDYTNQALELSKKVLAISTDLNTMPMTIALNTIYKPRLEMFGDKLKCYVEGNSFLVLTATDTSFSSGKIGLGTSKASVGFDDINVMEIKYPTDNPTIEPTEIIYDLNTIKLTAFVEDANKDSGEIKYILTDDNGANWKYWNSGWVASDGTYSQSNMATDINANLNSFPLNTKKVKFKAFLNSSGINFVQLKQVDINYQTNYIPNVPVLIPEPDSMPAPISVKLQWNASYDGDSDIITYELKLGTLSGANDIADVNTTNLYYDTPSLNAGTYYWSARACDSVACSSYSSEDIFTIFQAGTIMITATVLNPKPYVEGETINPEFWNGFGNVDVSFNCKDPNGIQDLNYAYINLSGTLTKDINMIYVKETGLAYKNIAPEITLEGDYLITPLCVDDVGNVSEDGLLHLYYTPSFSVKIDKDTNITYDLVVDLDMNVPATIVQMSFSCDKNTWSSWKSFTTYYPNFNLDSGQYGCKAYGEGYYYVYVAFTDMNRVYTQFDSIYAEGIEKEYEGWQNPSEPKETTTSLFSLAGLEGIGAGVVVLAVIVVGTIFFLAIRRRQYA